MRTAYVNGEFLPLEDARISILDRGFIFADGIYEVTAVVGGQLIDSEAHLARLERSLGEIELELDLSPAELDVIMVEMVARNELEEGIVYVQVTRGPAERDFAFPENPKPTLVLFTKVMNLVDNPAAKTGIKVITFPEIRWARCDIKSVSLLGPVLAKQAAAEAGVGEAWFVDGDIVLEGASSSVFIVTDDGEIVTRPTDHSILPGITRKSVMALATERQLKIVERPFTIDESKSAAEAFITSAGTFVTPVVEIDGVSVGDGNPGPMATRLREIYIAFAKSPAPKS